MSRTQLDQSKGLEAPVPVVGIKPPAPPGAASGDVTRAKDCVLQFTREIFSDRFEIVEREDSELPGERYFDVSVIDSGQGGDEGILARSDIWHRSLATLSEDTRLLFRLLIDVQ